jgi:hypothetical protein
MVAGSEGPLKRAADLLRAGKAEQAQPILVEILRENPNNPQAWFMMSYALTEPERQRYALEQALRADPYFSRARERLDKLGGSDQKTTPFFADVVQEDMLKVKEREEASSQQPAFLDPQPESPKARTEKGKTTKRSRGRGCFRLLLLVLLAGLLGSLVYFGRDYLSGFLVVPSNPTATQAQGFSTLPPTWTPSATDLP